MQLPCSCCAAPCADPMLVLCRSLCSSRARAVPLLAFCLPAVTVVAAASVFLRQAEDDSCRRLLLHSAAGGNVAHSCFHDAGRGREGGVGKEEWSMEGWAGDDGTGTDERSREEGAGKGGREGGQGSGGRERRQGMERKDEGRQERGTDPQGQRMKDTGRKERKVGPRKVGLKPQSSASAAQAPQPPQLSQPSQLSPAVTAVSKPLMANFDNWLEISEDYG